MSSHQEASPTCQAVELETIKILKVSNSNLCPFEDEVLLSTSYPTPAATFPMLIPCVSHPHPNMLLALSTIWTASLATFQTVST